jgi:AraC-like DNA-binding protein
MPEAATVAMQEARLVVETAAERGVAPGTLLARTGLTTDDLDDADGRLPRAAFDRLVERAVRLSGDMHFGLHAAERADGDHALPDALHYALGACTTVGNQFGMVARYARLLHADAETTLTADGSVARVTHDLPAASAVARRHLVERWLGALVLLARRHAGGFAPREVWFAHPATPDTSEHERIFQAPVGFERPVGTIILDRSALDLRLRDGDPALQRILDAHLATILPDVLPPDVSHVVRRRIREAAHGPLPTMGSVAAALAMSPRTLQRRLTGERTTYRRLLADVREDLARQHLAETRLSIAEIAFLLGFADVTSFHRAFKRWTGLTPRAYREGGEAPPGQGTGAVFGAFGQDLGAPGQGRARPAP